MGGRRWTNDEIQTLDCQEARPELRFSEPEDEPARNFRV